MGEVFSDTGIDIATALKEKAIILFILNPLIYPELSPAFGRLVLIDSKKAISQRFNSRNRTFFLFDEINVYASKTLIDLVNKSRSANVTCVLATQSLSDLASAEDEDFTQQIIENCNNYLVLRQNSAVNSENWANILGTRQTMEVTYQLQQKEKDWTPHKPVLDLQDVYENICITQTKLSSYRLETAFFFPEMSIFTVNCVSTSRFRGLCHD